VCRLSPSSAASCRPISANSAEQARNGIDRAARHGVVLWGEAGAPRMQPNIQGSECQSKARHQSQPRVYESAHWMIDTDRRALRAHGKSVSIGRRSFEMIEAPLQAGNE